MKMITRFLSLLYIPFLFLPLIAAGNAYVFPSVNPYATFNCGGGIGRCYGYDAQDITNILGAQTTLVTVALSHSGSSNLVGDSMWLVDRDTKGSSCWNSVCWIEIGETAKSGYYPSPIPPPSPASAGWGTFAYWADNRPSTSACGFVLCGYVDHPQGSLSSFGSKMQMSIYYVSPGTWQVRATGAKNFSMQSTNNGMVPDVMRFGAELQGSGTSGVNATMPTTTFTKNMYLVAGSSTWHYLSGVGYGSWDDGFPFNPPWSGWRVNPSASNGGGTWYACIKSSKWNGSQYPNPC